TLENGALTEATADVALAQVLARLAPELAPLELAVVQGRLQARALRDGYELGARGLQLTTAQGIAMQPTDFQFRWRGQGAPAGWAAAARQARTMGAWRSRRAIRRSSCRKSSPSRRSRSTRSMARSTGSASRAAACCCAPAR